MSDIKSVVNKNQINANKSLGQNFIYDENILSKIAATQEDAGICLEIGVGPGGLTRQLAKVCRKVVGVEIDRKFAPLYEEVFTEENIEIVFDDFLKADINELYRKHIGEPFSVCANLPYYITTPIIMKILDSDLPVKSITVLVQKEVAERIVSPPGSKKYGVLSVMTQCRGKASKLFDLAPGVFSPPPSVTSSLVKIDIGQNIIKSDIDRFRDVVRSAFSSRRKQLKGNIANSYAMAKAEAEKMLVKLDIKPTARAEDLSVYEFDRLTQEIIKSKP